MHRIIAKNIEISDDNHIAFIDGVDKSIKYGMSVNVVISFEVGEPVITIQAPGGLIKISINKYTYDWLITSFKQDMLQNKYIILTNANTARVPDCKAGFLEKPNGQCYLTLCTTVKNYAISIDNISNVDQLKQFLTIQ